MLQLQNERDTLRKKFVDAILEVQQKTGLKNLLLQDKISLLNDNIEKQEAIIGELELVTDLSADKVNKKLEVNMFFLLKNYKIITRKRKTKNAVNIQCDLVLDCI